MDVVYYHIETKGEAKGKAKDNELSKRMNEAGRVDEFVGFLTNSELQRKLFIEFKINKEKK